METVIRLKMHYSLYVLFNGPLVVLNIVVNAFYMFCIVHPLRRERIKQPVKFLLASLICCTVTYLMAAIVMVFSQITAEISKVTFMAFGVAVCSLTTSMSSSVWLNFFYYTQIVPAQRALSIWIKKNIKSIVYSIWIAERFYNCLDLTFMLLIFYSFDGFESSRNNFTMNHNKHMPVLVLSKSLKDMFISAVIILKAYFLFCLCVMVMSSGSTVLYLCGHMRRMVAVGQSISSPQFCGQVRVTITGILQGLLYTFCAVWTVNVFYQNSFTSFSPYIYFTVINLYMSGTTFNLGAGQAVFRQRAAHIWLRATQCCKTPQVKLNKENDTKK